MISMSNPKVQSDGPSVEMTDVVMEVGWFKHVCGLWMIVMAHANRLLERYLWSRHFQRWWISPSKKSANDWYRNDFWDRWCKWGDYINITSLGQ